MIQLAFKNSNKEKTGVKKICYSRRRKRRYFSEKGKKEEMTAKNGEMVTIWLDRSQCHIMLNETLFSFEEKKGFSNFV